MKKQIKTQRKVIIGISASIVVLLGIYLGISMYFSNHFYFGTKINNVDVSGKTVDEVEKQFSSAVNAYTLDLKGRNNLNQQIKSSDIGLKYDAKGKIQDIKDEQNPFAWIVAFSQNKDFQDSKLVSYDKNKLKEHIDNLSYFKEENIVKPQSAKLEYTNDGYKIVDEVYGSKVNKELLTKNIENAIINKKTNINLESAKCYEKPKYTAKSKEVSEAKNILDKYVSTKITYAVGDVTKVLDGSTINKWLETDENLNVNINNDRVREFVWSLARTYNTSGKTRNFSTSVGREVQVPGGDYGWVVNRYEESKDIISSIKNGQTITRKPKYAQTAVSHGANDIGNTYVEINLTRQHMWFYKNGSLITEGDVVTGNVSNNNGTPAGTYKLKYKEKNATLKGENYSTKVEFWMPFNGGIGIHDASWRDKFGGEIYKTGGSHGCINSPHRVASAIFNNIESGTPVVCYFE